MWKAPFPMLAAAVLAGGTLLAVPPAGRWEFDGSLRDASGREHHGQSPAAGFVPVDGGQALAAGVTVLVPDDPALRLAPHLRLQCRFRLDAQPGTTQVLITKDREYLLRVDWAQENATLSFFVYLDGQWEPRLRSLIPETGTWYTVEASWDGFESVLVVNGERWSAHRRGVMAGTENPVQIGPIAGVIDWVEIGNPGTARNALLNQLLGAADTTAADGATRQFGAAAGWDGWQGLGGATCTVRNRVLVLQVPDLAAMVVSPPLALPAEELPYVCLEAQTAEPTLLNLCFATDAGIGSVAFQSLSPGRTAMVEMAVHPAWRGTVRRLAIAGGSPGPTEVHVPRLTVSNHMDGAPYLHVRSVAPRRAVLRPGREEPVIAAVLNLGGPTADVRAELTVPDGVRVVGEAARLVPYLPAAGFDLVEWTVVADQPVTGEATVRFTPAAGVGAEAACPLRFLADPGLPRTGYVPEPLPARTDTIALMHYCALWKEGTHYGWGRIEAWPERRPAIGFYDEGTPEVADWHIKYALDHGIQAFIYCWYRADLEPEITHSLGHAIHEGLYEARYRDRFRFCIMWENGCAEGVRDADDLLDNLLPFWLRTYFTHPSYLKLDNMPVLFVWRPEKVGPQLGGTAATRRALDAMRERVKAAGFAGIRLIGCLDRADPPLQRRLAEEGWDATSGYALFPTGQQIVGMDVEGIPFQDHGAVMDLSKGEWEARRAAGPLPDIPNVMMGWDPRPWHGTATKSYRANPDPSRFEAACRDAKELVDQAPADAWYRGLVVLDNWTEFGEGHYIEPTVGTGFDYVRAIQRVFCTDWAPPEQTGIIPEDVGLEVPEKRYLARRELFGGVPWRPRIIKDNLVAWWRFDTDHPALLVDDSGSSFHLLRKEAPLEPGVRGLALVCGTGWASHPAHDAFFPASGITVSLWCRPDTAGQTDRWMLNTVASGANGYRLGLGQGRPVWQIPRETWSHSLAGGSELPVGEWSHVAATFDNRTMRLYVNGALAGEVDRPGLLRPSRSDLYLGTFGGERARFQGRLDEVRIHDRPLTATEIQALYAESTGAGR